LVYARVVCGVMCVFVGGGSVHVCGRRDRVCDDRVVSRHKSHGVATPLFRCKYCSRNPASQSPVSLSLASLLRVSRLSSLSLSRVTFACLFPFVYLTNLFSLSSSSLVSSYLSCVSRVTRRHYCRLSEQVSKSLISLSLSLSCLLCVSHVSRLSLSLSLSLSSSSLVPSVSLACLVSILSILCLVEITAHLVFHVVSNDIRHKKREAIIRSRRPCIYIHIHIHIHIHIYKSQPILSLMSYLMTSDTRSDNSFKKTLHMYTYTYTYTYI